MHDYRKFLDSSRWRPIQTVRVRYIRRLALLLLAAVTMFGFWTFYRGDPRSVSAFWLLRKHILFLALFLHACDIVTDSVLWTFVARQLGVKLKIRNAAILYMTGYAGLLLPVQLGRFARAAECSRIYPGTFSRFAAAEIVMLYFSALSAVAVFAGAAFYPWTGNWGVLISPLVMIAGLIVTSRFAFLLPHIPKILPENYFRQPLTILIAFGAMAGWILNGMVLYLVLRGLADAFQLWKTVLMVTSNLFVSVFSGVPGGLGITETYLGALMYWLQAPPEHLVVAVLAFRICTFWVWIPLGWVAMMLTGRWRAVIAPTGQD